MKKTNSKKVSEVGSIVTTSGTGNPFLALIEQFLTTESFPERLATSPLDEVSIATLTKQERLDILDRMQEEYFEPTSISEDIVKRLYRLIRKGYLNRDPTKRAVRKMTMELASYSGRDLSTLPWFATYAKGMTVIGVTGLGKSYEIKRGLQLIPQCIEHGPSQAAGWTSMKQVSWLYVAMSHDASLGGLLLQILYELDEAIGTEYSKDKSFTNASNEKMAVRLGIVFRNHGLGVLVIDEIQGRNFEGRGQGGLAATFFLRLLNFGIPVVLIGNPIGMEALYVFSQDVRRIGSGGTISMHALEKDDFDWNDCIVEPLLCQSVMPKAYQIRDAKKLVFQYSGGVRDFACRTWFSSQRIALDLGCTYVTEDHMKQAFYGSDFSDKEREIVAGFRDKDPIYLMQFADMPWEEYAARWKLSFDGSKFDKNDRDGGNSDKEPAKDEVTEESGVGRARSVPEKLLIKIKQQRTRKESAANRRKATKQSLVGRDMRKDGLKEVLISGLDKIC